MITVKFPLSARCLSTGRNGDFNTTGIELIDRHTADGRHIVTLAGLNHRGVVVRGDIEITAEAMDELAKAWLAQRAQEQNKNDDPNA